MPWTFVYIYILKENKNLYIMTEFDDLTKTLIHIALIFFMYVIIYNAYLYLVKDVPKLKMLFESIEEGFNVDAFKKANKQSLTEKGKGKIAAVKSDTMAAIDEKKNKSQGKPGGVESLGYGEGFAGSDPTCITAAQCSIQQTTDNNSKTLQSLTQKIDSLTQSVQSMHAASMSAAKQKGVNASKKAVKSIPNSPALAGLKKHAVDKMSAHV
jgi:hypothetical protein